MANAVKGWFLVFSLFASTVLFASGLTEESVNDVISKVDHAAINLNAGAISDVLSDGVTITMNINMQGQTQVLKPSKQQYITMLQQGWAMYDDYKYSKSNVKVDIQGQKAFVTADIKESMSIQGQNISGESKEQITIELVNGSLLITDIVAHTTM